MGYGSQGTKKDRRSSQEPKPKAARFNDTQFINYELDKASAAACKAWELDTDACFDALLKLCEAGYRVSLKWDDFSSAYGAFLQQTTAGEANFGYCLTGRGSSPYKACKQVLFKHFMVMGEIWESFADRKALEDIDD
jgi:hypothetical protein